MTRIALIYGSISGAVIIGAMVIGFELSGGEGALSSQWLGYLIMLVALSIIFVAIKQYRDRELGGVIKFLPAFLLGLFIAVIAGAAYVASWEVYLASTDYAFIGDYTAGVIEARRAEGLSGAALEAEMAKMESFRAQYGNPLYRLPMTFLEIFPVGLIVALVSAALLRNPKLLPRRA